MLYVPVKLLSVLEVQMCFRLCSIVFLFSVAGAVPAAVLPWAASGIRAANELVILSLVGFCSFCFPRARTSLPFAVAEIQCLDCCAF